MATGTSRTTLYRLRKEQQSMAVENEVQVDTDVETDDVSDENIFVEREVNNEQEDFSSNREEISDSDDLSVGGYDSDNDGVSYDQDVVEVSQAERLYEGSVLTVPASNVLVYKFAMKHNISNEGLSDLLQLLRLHCPSPNNIAGSTYLLKKFFGESQLKTSLHFYCSTCYMNCEEETPLCLNIHCGSSLTSSGSKSSFIEVSIEQQLQKILSREGIYEKCCEKNKDICGGKLYGEKFGDNSSTAFITFTFNTDGVPVFKSSNYSFWPLYLTINELPYHLRWRRIAKENRIFAGLWHGSAKPDMSLFLKPMCNTLCKLSTEGFVLSLPEVSPFICKAFLLCFSSDLPAKALVLNLVQFNGYWGCSKCKQKGSRVKCYDSHGSVQVYPYVESMPSGPPRKHDEVNELAEKAITGNDSEVFGVKGPSWLSSIPCFDLIRGTTVDYMHCVLLGICRQQSKLWLESKFHKEPWYIGTRVKEVDKCLCNLCPPSEMTRTPRSIQTTRKFWKAHELRSWLLHYSPIALFNVLPDAYYQHHLLLVEGVYLLLQNCVEEVDINQSQQLLRHYCFMYSALYGQCHMSANLHGLLHLPEVVRDLGPLWAHSCFPYESANGEVLKLFHGSQSVEKQVISKIGDVQMLPDFAKSALDSGSLGQEFYLKMDHKEGYFRKNRFTSTGDTLVLGSTKHTEFLKEELELLQKNSMQVNDIDVYPQLFIAKTKQTVSAASFSKATKRVNSCVMFTTNASTSFGLLQKVIDVKNLHAYAIIIMLRGADLILCHDLITNSNFHSHYRAFFPPRSNDLILVPAENIKEKCVYLDARSHHEYVFVSLLPNYIELE